MLAIRVTTGEGTYEVHTRPWTLRQWELRSKTKLSRIETDGIGVDDYLWLSWRQLSDDGIVRVPYEVWGPTVENLDLGAEEDADRPTRPGASDDSS